MELQKCYYASFNVGKVEVWRTEFYQDKNSIFSEIENSKDDIIEQLIDNSLFYNEKERNKIFKSVIQELKHYGIFKDKDNELDFFIAEQPIWENYEQKRKIV